MTAKYSGSNERSPVVDDWDDVRLNKMGLQRGRILSFNEGRSSHKFRLCAASSSQIGVLGFTTVYRFFHFRQANVSHVTAFDGKNDVLRDIAGVVTDAFQ